MLISRLTMFKKSRTQSAIKLRNVSIIIFGKLKFVHTLLKIG